MQDLSSLAATAGILHKLPPHRLKQEATALAIERADEKYVNNFGIILHSPPWEIL